jgi:hypothetical protein
VHPDSHWFQKLLRDFLGDTVRFTGKPDMGDRAAILVDCIESTDNLRAARQLYPSHPVVGVLPQTDTARIIEVLAGNADGVIALTDPPASGASACTSCSAVAGGWAGPASR